MRPTLRRLGIDLFAMLGFPIHFVYPHHTYSYPLYTTAHTFSLANGAMYTKCITYASWWFLYSKKARFTDWVLPVLLASSKQPVYVVTNGYVQIGTTWSQWQEKIEIGGERCVCVCHVQKCRVTDSEAGAPPPLSFSRIAFPMDISAFFLDCGTRKIFWKEEEEEASVLRGTITHPKKEEGKMLVFQASYRRRNELHATSWLIVFVFTSTIQSGEIALSVSRVFVYNGDGSFCMLSWLWKY